MPWKISLSEKTISKYDAPIVIERLAHSQDLLFLGITDLNTRGDAQRYELWLKQARNGSMTWMSNHLELRANPEHLLTGAKSVLIFGFSYYLGDHWQRPDDTAKPRIAQYARLKDYHSFLRKKIANVQKNLSETAPPNTRWRITVDTAPVLERALAFKTGSGFIGKNTCFIHPRNGSFLLLGELFSTWSLTESLDGEKISTHRERAPDGGCGSCKRCQVHCPTGALDEDYRIDARKCISYWTIEHRGLIPINYWPWVAQYLFGCDICQLVCPYNRNVEPSLEAKRLIQLNDTPDLLTIVTMNQKIYETLFGGTPLTRAKISGLRRNALIAGIVKNDERILKILTLLEEDSDPVVRGTAKQLVEYQLLQLPKSKHQPTKS
jgi:epoxyqueuosine reductase